MKKLIILLMMGTFFLSFGSPSSFGAGKGGSKGSGKGAGKGKQKQSAKQVSSDEKTDTEESKNSDAVKEKGRKRTKKRVSQANKTGKRKPLREKRSDADDRTDASAVKGKGKTRTRQTAADQEARKAKQAKKRIGAARGNQKGKAGKGKAHQQRIRAMENKLKREHDKHNRRIARLARIRELAEQQGKAETVARIDKLMGKEQNRFGRKTKTMLEQMVQAEKAAAGEKPQKIEAGKAGEDIVGGIEKKTKAAAGGKMKGKGKGKNKLKADKNAEDKVKDQKENNN